VKILFISSLVNVALLPRFALHRAKMVVLVGSHTLNLTLLSQLKKLWNTTDTSWMAVLSDLISVYPVAVALAAEVAAVVAEVSVVIVVDAVVSVAVVVIVAVVVASVVAEVSVVIVVDAVVSVAVVVETSHPRSLLMPTRAILLPSLAKKLLSEKVVVCWLVSRIICVNDIVLT